MTVGPTDGSLGSMAETPSILIVDDEEIVLQAIIHTLQDIDAKLIPTTSASEAIHLLNTYKFSVLLCDLNLDNATGNDVLAAARANNPQIVSILVTGASDIEGTIRAVNEGGIWKCIQKPWQPEEFVTNVLEALARFNKLDQAEDALTDIARRRNNAANAPTRSIRAVSPSEAETKITVPIATGTKLGDRYVLQEQIGEGGTGVVYRADDTLLNLSVAIKMLSPEFTTRPGAIKTLKEEARIAMQLSHRHIVRLHNLQKHGPNYFIVMEYVDGCTLRDVLYEDGCFPLETVIPVIRVCADSLSYAHRHGVIHKDLKLDNLLLAEDGVLKIIDFGIACLVDAQPQTEQIAGTPAYMSPEQKIGSTVDERTDIYSLAIIIYELLRGILPFPEEASQEEILGLAPDELDGLPDSILGVLNKALSANRSDRHPTITQFASEFIDAVST